MGKRGRGELFHGEIIPPCTQNQEEERKGNGGGVEELNKTAMILLTFPRLPVELGGSKSLSFQSCPIFMSSDVLSKL